MLLAIDIGNTNITVGLYKGKKLLKSFKMSTDKNRTSDEYKFLFSYFIKERKIADVIISSVVPPINTFFEELSVKFFKVKPIFVDHKTDMAIKILYDNPKEVGADRLVNACGAFEKYGGPCIIVDFGTATTFDVITKNAEYLGGVICAGIQISAEALFARTAKLPKVDISLPTNVIGRNTIESIQSGLVYGHIGQIKSIIENIKNELKQKNVKVIATGGLVRFISKLTRFDIIDETLTLDGLRIIFERNK